jgi:hypothetical protein
MDWSQIYDESGLDSTPTFPVFHPPLGPPHLLSFASAPSESGYTALACYIFTINYILGVGCLGVPFGFARAGLVLGSLLVVAVTLLSYATVSYVAESVGRAEELAKMPCERGSKCWLCLGHHGPGGVCREVTEGTPLKRAEDSYDALPPPTGGKRGRSDTMDSEADVDWSRAKSYEVVSLCQKFLGTRHVVLYQLSLLGLMYVRAKRARRSERPRRKAGCGRSGLRGGVQGHRSRSGCWEKGWGGARFSHSAPRTNCYLRARFSLAGTWGSSRTLKCSRTPSSPRCRSSCRAGASRCCSRC